MGTYRFSVLGGLSVRRGTDALDVGAPQQQAMLAVLLLSRNRTAGADELLDALWGDRPPGRPVNTVRTYAWRWRRLLEPDPASPAVLVSCGDGYRLAVPAESVDALTAERLACEAGDALRTDDRDAARSLLTRALDLWTGEPLRGIPGPFAERHRQRLRALRLDLLERRLTLDLRDGRGESCVPELTELVDADPLRERFHALLMSALGQAGRRADALTAFRRARQVLAEELGVEPGAELVALHQRMLRGEGVGVAVAGEPAGMAGSVGAVGAAGRTGNRPEKGAADARKAAAEVVVPHRPAGHRNPAAPAQLPAALPDFTGREELLAQLVPVLTEQGRSGPAVVALSGMGGVGKTTLAVQAAQRVRAAFPDGQLYADLRGNDGRPAAPDAVLADFLTALGADPRTLPETLDARAARFRSEADGRRLLLVLDDARDAAQVRPLLPGSAGCAVLVTSRTRLTSLPTVLQRDLDVLTEVEALRMLARTSGPGRVDAEPVAAREVLDACGYLPLAVRIVAARLSARPAWSIGTLGERLLVEHRRLDELRTGDLAVRATFELGYRQLTPEQARAFRQAALLEGAVLPVPTVAAVLGLSEPDAGDLLESLVDLAVLQSPRPDRYRFHDLLRLFARHKSAADDPAEADRVLSRQLDFLLATACEAFRWAVPGDPVAGALAGTAGTEGRSFPSLRLAREWAVDECETALALAARIADGTVGSDNAAGSGIAVAALRRAVDLLIALSPSGPDPRLGQVLPTAHRLVEAAVRAGDRHGEGRARFLLGTYCLAAGQPADAEAHTRAAAEACRAAGDLVVLRQAHNDLGLITSYLGRPHEAVGQYDEALALARRLGHRSGERVTTVNAAIARARSGRAAEAVPACEAVLADLRTRPDAVVEAFTLYALGLALQALHRHEEAVDRFTACLRVSEEAGLRGHGTQARFRMADSLRALGALRPALEQARRALDDLQEAGAARDTAHCLVVLGRIRIGLGEFAAARDCLERARDTCVRLGLPDTAEVTALLAAVPAG
ncbi:NB-ARC domain-containing protein [Streptomyces sp. LP11]|uniref:NB-ARC domain-containing protein n=1 Tax=Streptomyces pyxinicus TaxID=2970331 RepID=A0ABT2AVX7_9ACTN|nr:BTAD domain-containing putative transcriptional regulator [Streptomyces sp. LP11]MCS0600399.1 NB-ARC domain-containing protein [Streptomyces sp. LP11]